jgi:hypothetical protein
MNPTPTVDSTTRAQVDPPITANREYKEAITIATVG